MLTAEKKETVMQALVSPALSLMHVILSENI